jgi:hypothetical protein
MISKVLEKRDEEEKVIKKAIKNHAGEDFLHPYCIDLFYTMGSIGAKKTKFKKSDY